MFVIAAVSQKIGGSGPDAGFVGMAMAFLFLSSLPVMVLFVGLLFAFPRGDALRQAVVLPTGVGYLIVFFLAVHLAQSTTTFLVKDAAGNPLQGVSLQYKHYAEGGTLPLFRGHGTVVSGGDGRMSVTVFRNETIGGDFTSETGMKQSVQIYPSYPGGSQRGVSELMYRWDGCPRFQSFTIPLPRRSDTVIPVFLKPEGSMRPLPYVKLFEGEFLSQPQRFVLEPCYLSGLGSCLESFELLPFFAEQLSKGRRESVEALKGLAKLNCEIRKCLPQAANTKALNELYEWAGGKSPVATPEEKQQFVKAHLDEQANRLIEIALSHLCPDSYSYGCIAVLEELGVGSRPAMKFLPGIMADADQKCQKRLLGALWYMRPAVQDVEFLLTSDNPRWVTATVKGMEMIPKVEIPATRERLVRLRRENTDSTIQRECDAVLNELSWRRTAHTDD